MCVSSLCCLPHLEHLDLSDQLDLDDIDDVVDNEPSIALKTRVLGR